MIDLHNRLPLPETEANEIRTWLTQAACRKFLAHLANRAAFFTAEAGNALIEKNPEAPIKAEEAAAFNEAVKVIDQCREEGYQFPTVDLQPKTVIAPTAYARNNLSDRTEKFPGSSIAPASRPLG